MCTNCGDVSDCSCETPIELPFGPRGPIGPAGPAGAAGAKGDKGDQGEQGVQGIQGVQGDKGDNGDQGTQGPVGPQGVQGETGPQGDPGVGFIYENPEAGGEPAQSIDAYKILSVNPTSNGYKFQSIDDILSNSSVLFAAVSAMANRGRVIDFNSF